MRINQIIHSYLQGAMKAIKDEDMEHFSKDCEKALSVLKYLNKLQDSVPWQYYFKCANFLADEVHLHPITYALILSIKINGHCYYLRDIFQAIHSHIQAFNTLNITYITAKECHDKTSIHAILNNIHNDADNSKKISLHFIVDQKILGGFKLIANSRIYDYSVANIIAKAQEQIAQQFNIMAHT